MTSAAANSMGKPGSEGSDTSNDTGNNGSGTVGNSNVGNSITGNVADKIHVPDFYSLYALAVCEGNFSEAGTRSLTRCHPYFSGSDASTIPSLLSTTLNLTIGTLNLNVSPADLGLTYAAESTLDGLNTLLKAFAVIFSIGIGFTGLSFLSSIPAVALGTDTVRKAYPWGVWTNLVFASTAVFFLILAGLVAAAGAKVAEARINELGDQIGLAAVAGKDWN
ncbi:hypothetical protein NEMBOFW57_002876 [Staphylotrichum longicolle]|uniref:Uncharacterized protein n=1 Tax=Staphylotrichum longicolle TaxID=669026 RepID=A0AAD4I2U9_9PEZI|nr:hypothetical protein NEMBOFW57_002876 [Staphylotrichum longicolle]